jgi:predicted XRE-type DNA-binding protein
MNSNIKSADEQGGLLLSRAQPLLDVAMESIMARRTLLGALNLCIELSGLEDKEIYLPLGIDAGHFSNLRKGKGHFPIDKIGDLMDMCRNEVPLVWLAHRRGYGLVVLRSEAERRADMLAAQLAESDRENKLMKQLLAGRVN